MTFNDRKNAQLPVKYHKMIKQTREPPALLGGWGSLPGLTLPAGVFQPGRNSSLFVMSYHLLFAAGSSTGD